MAGKNYVPEMKVEKSPYRWIGKGVPRIDGQIKVRGTLQFPGDYYPENALICRPVFAPYPHARLLEIQCEDALLVPGVLRVMTHRDVPGSNRYGYRRDHPVLCDDKTRYLGDMVAVVIAEYEDAAKAGVEQVKVLYEPLELVTDPEQALSSNSPAVHSDGNVLHQIHYTNGEVEKIFNDPGIVTVEQTYSTQLMDHSFLETEAGIAFPDDGGVRVIAGGQNAYYDQQQVADCLGLPLEKVRMVEPYSGGAFGGKGDITVQIVVALGAWLTGRPCKMVWSRQEHFLAGVKRHPAKIWLRLAASTEGQLLALEGRIIADTGAYAVFGDAILELMAENITGPYRIPNVKLDAWSVYTNNAVCGAFRGFGATQACLAIESLMSELAKQIGFDSIEFRQQNLLEQGDYAGLGHEILLPLGVRQVLETAANHPLWKNRHRLCEATATKHRGIGVALSMKGYGLGVNDAQDYSAAKIELTKEGRYLLETGIVELGQGSFTAMVQMAAEKLGCAPELIDFQSADTYLHPDAGTTAASRVTYSVGLAVVEAATRLAAMIRQLCSYFWEIDEEQVVFSDGFIRNRLTDQIISLSQAANLASEPLQISIQQRIPFSEQQTKGALAHPHMLYSSNVQIVQLSVDVDTGEVQVERVVCFPEAGQVINRFGLEGQCEGGVAQGIGYALLEKVNVEDAQIMNGDFTRYPIPTITDIPAIEVIPVNVPEATGPYGAKGAAENATIPTAPAILNAIAEAIGVRFTSLPVTPERIYQTLHDQEQLETSQN
jgi:CO/xanthine dehydrogenase Mo-binding subunit